MTALPISLQNLISEAKVAIDNREPSDDDTEADIVMEAADEFLETLSRGEYSQELYFRCQAEDCEEAGDWDGAIDSYQRILDLKGDHAIIYWRAHNSLAALYNLLGDDESALKHFQAALDLTRSDFDYLLQETVVRGSWQLLHMRRVSVARAQIKECFSASTSETADNFVRAKLLISLAACDVASGRIRRAKQSLMQAQCELELFQVAINEYFPEEAAPGVVSAFSLWWLVEAELCHLSGNFEAELQAWQQSLEKARQLASDDPISIVFAEYRVLSRLLSVGDAYQRQGLIDEASACFTEAEAIRARRKFPESTLRPFSIQPRPIDGPILSRLCKRCMSFFAKWT